MFVKEWKLTDPEAQAVMKRNCAVYDKLQEILSRRCQAPLCNYMLSSMQAEQFGVPGFGDVCALCYYMYQALQSPDMKNKFYFRQLHEQWVKDNTPEKPRWEKLG